MPWEIRKSGDRWCVHKQGESESLACHDTEDAAKRQMAALYASESSSKAADLLGHDGTECKALDDSGHVGGYLVLWGSPDATDASTLRDYFEPDTNFGRVFKSGADVLFHHGLPRVGKEPNPLADRILGDAEVKADETGVWMEAVLELRDNYERKVWEMVKAGKLGLSSGTANHLMRRTKQSNGAHKITRWPIVEASITPTPAEPRTSVFALKSLMGLEDAYLFDETTSPIGSPESSGRMRDELARAVSDAARLRAWVDRALKSREAEGRSLPIETRNDCKAIAEHFAAIYAASVPIKSDESAEVEPAPEPIDPDEFRQMLDSARKALQPTRKS